MGTTFLKQSIMLAFEDRGVEVAEIPPNGIWIAQVFSILENRVYRMSVNTRGGKHYDLLLGTATDTGGGQRPGYHLLDAGSGRPGG